LNLKNHSDFYKLTETVQTIKNSPSHLKEIEKRGGGDLLKQYKNAHTLLSTLYPQHEWLPWKFPVVSRGFWSNVENQKKFLETISKELKITSLELW
jgi:hypothetical protein